MPDDQTRQQKITALRSLPDDVRKAIAGLDDAQLDTPYRDGGWTVRQVVHHLADSHMNASIRARLILTERHPTLRPYDQDAWARLTDAAGAPVGPSLTILDGVHDRLVRLLEHCSDTDWARPAHHPDSGAMTLETLLTTYAAHGIAHVGQILGLRKRKGW